MKLKLLFPVLILAVLVVGCGGGSKPVSAVKALPADAYDMSVVVTVGNHSYIPINLDGRPDQQVGVILGTLQAFESTHPNLEVTGWQIEKEQRAYNTSDYIFGMWVDHRPKK